jgi:hypothetical protein
MGWSWARVSVVAIALSAFGCCPDADDNHDDERLHCDLTPTPGTIVTVKGTAQYKTSVDGEGVVEGISYYDGENTVFVADPKQPFSVTVELEAGDLFESSIYGYAALGSISAENIFTPANGAPKLRNLQFCTTQQRP